MRAAFYKGRKPGIAGIFDVAVHHWEDGCYAHVELVFADGSSASSTFLDGGVRFTKPGDIDFTADDWDFIELVGFDEASARAWFEQHVGDKYDVWGDARFVCGLIHQRPHEEFCSEAVGAALELEDAWRFDPNALACALRRCVGMLQKAAA